MMGHKRLPSLLLAVIMGVTIVACTQSGRPQIGPGEAIYKSKCRACHLRPSPRRLTPTGWEKLIGEHRKKRVPLSDEQRGDLLDFLSGRERKL